MSYQKLLRQMVGVTLVMLLLVGCGAPAATSTPVPSTATPIPEPPTPTLTPIPPTPTPAPQIPVGRIRGILINTATGKPLAGETLAVALIREADKLDEKTCTIKAGASSVMLEAEQTGVGYPALSVELLTDEQGGFLGPGKYLGVQLIIPPGTDPLYLFLKWGNRCFVVRDESENPIEIQMGTQAGVDLGEILIPAE